MYIATVPNRKSPPAILLRAGYREGRKVKTRTIANITHWPTDKIEALRRVLKGEQVAGIDDLFETVTSAQHGHVRAVLLAMERLGLGRLLDSRPSRERDLVMAMIAWRIIRPASKLATQRAWSDTTLPGLLRVDDADEDDLYAAMDWLLARQDKVECKIAARHLTSGGIVLYDLSSSYFEGCKCPLAKLGYSRDGKKGMLQVNYGLLTDGRGCPVSVSIFAGNTGDPTTLLPAVTVVRERFGVHELVLVGDRGMISWKQIDALKKMDGVAWVTALKTGAIRSLVEGGNVQLGLFDERNLFEIEHPDYPGERLVACRNHELGKLRAHKRQSLIDATTKKLEKARGMVTRGKLKSAEQIGVRVGKVVNKYKVAKHFVLDIRDGHFAFSLDNDSITAEAALDGIYIIRTNVPPVRMTTAETVRTYKSLSRVERAFRSLKSVDLKVRPIHHHTEDRVRAHIFLCVLAYYVEWHMRQVLRPLLFDDEDLEAKKTGDPVAPAERSTAALTKATSKKNERGQAVHSFPTLIDHLGSIVRNICVRKGTSTPENVIIESTPNATQQRAYDLIKGITV